MASHAPFPPSFSLQPERLAGFREVALAVAAFLCALLAIWQLVPPFGLSVVALLIAPLGLLAWSFGIWGALIGSALALPASMLVCLRATSEPMLLAIASAHLGILFIACITGRLRDLSVRIARELEEHARAVRALRHSQTRNQALLGALPDFIFRLDASGKVTGASGGRGRASSMRSAAYLDQLLPVEAAELMSARVREVLSSGEPSELEYSLSESEEAGDYEARLVKCAPTQVLVIVRNVTRQKRLERELIAAREAALEAARSKSKFLANMSHEIRTPMNGVIGMTNLLLETALTQEQREYAMIIQKSGQALLGIIDDILDFAKIEAGRLELDRIEFDLAASVEESLEAFAGQAHAKGLDLGCVFERTVPERVLGDPTRLRQVLVHLLGNAVKFTEHGHVLLEVDHGDEGRLRFRVRDTGPGIAQELVPRLFRPLLLGENGGGFGREGTGLGLAIARELVQLMDGEIHYEDAPGGGALFSFQVRLEVAAARAGTGPTPDLGGVRVLLVRAPGAPRSLLELSLERLGLSLDYAVPSEVVVALRRARAVGHPHLAVFVEAGRELAAQQRVLDRLRSDDAAEPVPVVLILDSETYHAAGEELRRSATRVLHWPVRRAELVGCLSALLGRSEPVALAPSEPRALSARVLVAEDNPINQRVAQRTLELLGCTSVIVDDGQQAVEAALAGAFDVIIMDCQMPIMDGLEATRIIRAKESGRRTPIIAMTAGISDEDRERFREAGMDAYVLKPVTLEHLRDTLAKLVAPAPSTRAAGEGGVVDEAIDRHTLDELRALGGDDDGFLRDLVELFHQQAPRHLEVARAALDVGDLAAAAKAAHTLKSASSYLGARRLAELCKHVELRARAGDAAEVGRTIEALMAEYDAVRHALSSEVG